MAMRSEAKVKDEVLIRRIGDRILQERRRQGLTLEILAGLSGIHQNTLSNAENGRGISLLSLLKIASVLNVKLEYFV
jgi:transcriptional regulator with XRE-family HTH domain